MKSLIIFSSVLFMSLSAFGKDVSCKCEQKKCSDINIQFKEAPVGTYLKFELGYGEKSQEGFARVTVDKNKDTVTYVVGNFALVESGSDYSLVARPHVCELSQ